MTGQKLLQYQILEKLGEGGMGVVYKARDTHLNRFVALKILPAKEPGDTERKRRFAQEARAASALNHPNIITIHEINQADGVDFICMEFVSGKTLEHLIPHHGLHLNLALQYGVQIADALARSHAAGIIHRDLKPSNVMVDEHGLIKILDFGVAKLTDPLLHGEYEPTLSLAHTRDGKVVGTPTYMSPEQVEGKSVDARSDIFSFGSLLYEMLSGQAPFRRDSQPLTMAAILREEPKPLTEVVTGMPREVDRIVKSCLRKDPVRRLQHMDDVRAMLLDVKEESESGLLLDPVRPSKRTSKLPVPRWLAISVAAVAIVLGVKILVPKPSSSPTVTTESPLTARKGFEADPSFSPDGTRVAFSWYGDKQDNQDIYIKLVGDEALQRITTDPADDFSPAWCPDGLKIAFLRKKKDQLELLTVGATPGGSETVLAQLAPNATPYRGNPNRELAWADSEHLAYFDRPPGEEPGLFLLSINGSKEKHRLTTCARPMLRDSDPAFSPTDRTLAFTRMAGFSYVNLYLLSLTADWRPAGEAQQIGQQFQLEHEFRSITQPTWGADGRSLVVVGDVGTWRLRPSGLGQAERLPYNGDQLDISRRDSYRLVYREGPLGGNIGRMELDPKKEFAPLVDFAASTRVDNDPQYSNDGKHVVFASSRKRSGNFEIWICNSDGSALRQLTNLDAKETASPRWFPDDRRVVFDSDKEGHFEIYSIGVDGSSEAVRLNPHHDHIDDATPSVSADGDTIYFSRRTSSSDVQVWRMPERGGSAVQLTKLGGFYPVEAGGFVYYEKSQEPVTEVWRVPTQGGEEQKVLESVGGRRFAVRNNGIYFVEWPDSHSPSSLQFLSFATGKRQKLRDLPRLYLAYDLGFTVSPDGRYALLTRSEQPQSDLVIVENFR